MKEWAGKRVDTQKDLQKILPVFEEAILRSFVNLPAEVANDERINYVLDENATRVEQVFPEQKNGIEAIIQSFKQKKFEGNDEFAAAYAQSIASFLMSHFTIPELETRIRENRAEHNSWEIVNRALSYSIEYNEIYLHISPTFTDKPAELRRYFLDGMKELAQRLKSPELEHIKTIAGESWIVFKHPNIITMAGFTIAGENLMTQEARAEITREQLIERYGD